MRRELYSPPNLSTERATKHFADADGGPSQSPCGVEAGQELLSAAVAFTPPRVSRHRLPHHRGANIASPLSLTWATCFLCSTAREVNSRLSRSHSFYVSLST